MEKIVFDKFRSIIYEKSGISINQNKVALVSTRISKRMRELDISDDKTYLNYVLEDESGEEIIHLLDVISTNVTSFFREKEHFEYLTTLINQWYEEGQKRFRIWCAASSTGEEPYSLAMTVMDALNGRSADVRILATDISTRVLRQCLEGCYSEEKVESIQPQLRNRFMERIKNGSKTMYSVNKEIRNMVTFSRLNLSSPPFPMHGPFDVIFCRNVMIYFDNLVRSRLLTDIHRLLRKDGYFFVGHAESLTGILSGLKPVIPSIYKKS